MAVRKGGYKPAGVTGGGNGKKQTIVGRRGMKNTRHPGTARGTRRVGG